MLRVACIAALAMLAACPGGDDDGPGPDAAGDQGLLITWSTTPAIPGDAGGPTVSVVEVELSSLRALGDAAPGDARTTATDLELDWRAGISAPPLAFPAAPAGLYASLELGSGGDDEHVKLEGTVVVRSETYTYRIEDETPLSLSLPVDAMVEPGARTEIPVVLDVAAVLAAVPFDQLEPDGTELRLESGDPEMAAVRAALTTAFHVAPVP